MHGANMKRTRCVSIRKINWLVMKTDTADIYRDIYTEHTNCVRKIWNILMLYLPVHWDLKKNLYDKAIV